MSLDEAKIQNILVISLSNIGDIILTTPVISSLRSRFPKSQIIVLVGPKGASILENSETINEVIIFDKKAPLRKQISLIIELRKKKFDLVIDLRNTAIPFFLTPKYRTSFFTDKSLISMRQKHLNRINFLYDVSNVPNHFHFFSETEKQSALKKLNGNRSFIVIAPGAGSTLKRWTISGFSELVEHLTQKGQSIVVVGDKSERDLGTRLKMKNQNVINLMGELTLRELAGLVSEALLVVANDSAVMHLANELGRPTVAIFGPTNAVKYGQRGFLRKIVRLDLQCMPCEQAQCVIRDRKCLDELQASSVIDACEELLTHAN